MMKKIKKIFPIIMVAALIVTAAIPLKTMTQKQEEPSENENVELIAEIDDFQVSVLGDTSSLPQDATVEVTKIEQEELEEVSSILQDNLDKEGTALAYDITLYNQQHEEIQPTGDVQVLLKNMNLESSVDVYHVDTDSSEVEEMVSSKDPSGELMFETNHFSTYAIFSDTEAIQTNGYQNVIYTYSSGKGLIQVSTNNSCKNSYDYYSGHKYNLQIRVYENNKLLGFVSSKYFDNRQLLLALDLNEYKIDEAYCADFLNYAQASIKDPHNKVNADEGSLQITLNSSSNLKNYLDIYVSKEIPLTEGELSITNTLKQENLLPEDLEFESLKYYKYQIYDGQTKQPITGRIEYQIYDNEAKKTTTTVTQNDGYIMIRPSRTAIITSLPGTHSSIYVAQMNGNRYDTSWNYEGDPAKEGKQSDSFLTGTGGAKKLLFTNKRKPINELITTEKTATSTASDWEERKYDLTLKSGYLSNETTIKKISDIQLILDISGSMIYTDVPHTAGSMDNLNKLNKNFAYFTESCANYNAGVYISSPNEEDFKKQLKKYHMYEGSFHIKTNSSGFKNYGVKTSETNKLVYYDEALRGWYYVPIESSHNSQEYKLGNAQVVDENFIKDYNTLYSDRSSVLIDALSRFIEGLSDDTNISIVTFGTDAYESLKWTKIKEDKAKIENVIDESYGYYWQDTKLAKGLNAGVKLLNEKSVDLDRPVHTIVFTDGEATDVNDVSASVNNLKDLANVFAIGILDESEASLLKDTVASTPDECLASKDMNKIYEYLEIILDYVGIGSVSADVKDVIDPRFILLNDKGEVAKDGETITSNGHQGTVHIKDEQTYVTWSKQIIVETKPWNSTLKVQAKDDFLGSNGVTTNGKDSYVDASDSYLTAQIPFISPKVNVKTLELTNGQDTAEVFWGDDYNFEKLFSNKLPDFKVKKLTDVEMDIPNKLTQEECTKLISGEVPSYEKEYSYEGESFGKIVYTLDNVKDDSMSIIATYIPNSTTETNKIAVEQKGEWEYKLNLLKGELQITKKIDNQYTNEPINADQSFVFRVERRNKKEDENPADVMYQTISFSADETVIEKTVTITGLKKGFYSIIEEPQWSWKYDELLNNRKDNYDSNVKENELLYIGSVTNDHNGAYYYGLNPDTYRNKRGRVATVSFTNHLNNSFNTILGDVARAINHLLAK